MLTVDRDSAGVLSSRIDFIDMGAHFAVDPTDLHDGELRCHVVHPGYELRARLSPNGSELSGTWTSPAGAAPFQLKLATKSTLWAADAFSHEITFVTVEPGVKLEVLNWGGRGRPIILTTGLGDNAHIFDPLAIKLRTKYHVYGITRRGFGASDTPPDDGNNYSGDRLGDDVIAVMDQLKLTSVVLAAHSIGGQELSSVETRYPERVAGLIYIEAGYPYALYPGSDYRIDGNNLRRTIHAIQAATTPGELKPLFQEALKTILPKYMEDIAAEDERLRSLPGGDALLRGTAQFSGREERSFRRARIAKL